MIATIGQVVWFLTWDDRQGPAPARGGPVPLLQVFFPEGPQAIECSHWLVEDGTVSGWTEIPADGAPIDLFA